MHVFITDRALVPSIKNPTHIIYINRDLYIFYVILLSNSNIS